jgi:hypothetical protein
MQDVHLSTRGKSVLMGVQLGVMQTQVSGVSKRVSTAASGASRRLRTAIGGRQPDAAFARSGIAFLHRRAVSRMGHG